MDRKALIKRLQARQGPRSLRAFAASDLKCSAAYLSKIYSGETDPGPTIMDYLGLEREVKVTYKPKLKTQRRWR